MALLINHTGAVPGVRSDSRATYEVPEPLGSTTVIPFRWKRANVASARDERRQKRGTTMRPRDEEALATNVRERRQARAREREPEGRAEAPVRAADVLP